MQEGKRHELFQKLFVVGGKHKSFPLFFTTQLLFLIVTVYASFGVLTYLSENVKQLEFLDSILRPIAVFWLIVIVTVHEFGHLFWIRKFDIPVMGPIPILFAGAMTLNGRRLTSEEAIPVYLSGPFTGFIAIPIAVLGILTGQIETVVLAFAWSFINLLQLLPLYPSDGGVALAVMLSSIIGRKWSKRICYTITSLFFVLILVLSKGNRLVAVLILIVTVFLMISDRSSMAWFERYSENHLDVETAEDRSLKFLGFSSISGTVVYWGIATIYLGATAAVCLMYIAG